MGGRREALLGDREGKIVVAALEGPTRRGRKLELTLTPRLPPTGRCKRCACVMCYWPAPALEQ